MAVFISVATDPFEETFSENRVSLPLQSVRRPLRGIQIKEDTYASIRVLSATGDPVGLFDSSSSEVTNGIGRSSDYANFIIQNLQESRVEKQQIVETFGEDYIFFFGERPRFITVRGVLLNTADFNWKSEFWKNYEEFLRGTKLVELNARMYLYFDDIVVEGYIVSASTNQQAMTPYHLPFNFQMFVSNYAILSSVGSVYFQGSFADQGDTAIPAGGLVAPTDAEQAAAASDAARIGAGGGLLGFLSASSEFLQNASFSVQSTLENIRNTFYGRRLVLPEGLGQAVATPTISNQASFSPPKTALPIHEMTDEYVNIQPGQAAYDEREIQRVNEELRLREPEELEKRARAELAEWGIFVTRRETEYLLLGRAAFAGSQKFGSFGIRQADGVFSNPLTA